MSNEITVKLECSIKEICNILESKNFKVIRSFILGATYFIPNTLILENMNTREILSTAILIRDITEFILNKENKDTVATGWNFVQGTLNLEKNAYIKLSLANYDKCTLEIINQSNGAWSRTMDIDPSQNAKTHTIWTKKAPVGSYFFKITFPSSKSIFAGQFLWTDSLN